jgi:hypothetical protein
LSAHATHEIHKNSLAAWHAGERSGYFSDRELEVLNALQSAHRPLRDREIMAACGYAELAKVQPRISTLIDRGVLVEVGRSLCPETGKRVRLVDIAPPATLKQDSFLP